METIEVCGCNEYYQISEESNNKTSNNIPFVYPPQKLKFKVSSILSYSPYTNKTVLVTKEGLAYGIGENRLGGIDFSLPKEILSHFTKIELSDSIGFPITIISAVCSSYSVIYLVSDGNTNHLVYTNTQMKETKPVILNTNGHNPVSLFGGSTSAAAIDSEGGIFNISSILYYNPTSPLQQILLPDGEKASSVACCFEFIIALSTTGRIFKSRCQTPLYFTEDLELKRKEIIMISGYSEHCFAVCKDGRVFGIGSNLFGQLGKGKGEDRYYKFTLISSLRDYKIVSAFTGGAHSLFVTNEGKVFGCGTNRYGQLFLSSGPSEKDIYTPQETTITDASFIVCGAGFTVVFKHYVPPMIPNKAVDPNASYTTESIALAALRAEIKELKEKLKDKDKELENIASKYEAELSSLKSHYEKVLKKEQPTTTTTTTVDEMKQIEILDTSMIESYEKVSKISSGGFGDVYKVFKRVYYALKVLKKEVNGNEIRYFLSEYEIMNMLDHPNIVKTFGLFLHEHEPASIVLEFCPTNLESFVKVSGVDLVFAIYQIVEGMKYVHFRHVIHRDLKPTNILIGTDGLIKISDFGISKLMSTEQQTMTVGVGTLPYMAPEIIDNIEDYDEKVDVYSFGVLLFFMLSGGELPKIKMSEKMNGKKAQIPASFTKFATELINSCWNFNSKDRPSFSDILCQLEEHDYMLADLDAGDVKEVKSRVKNHKTKIPKY